MSQSSVDLAVFTAMPSNSILLQANVPQFTITAATAGYVQTSGMSKHELIGTGMFEAFPPPPDDPDHIGVKELRESLKRVLEHKVPDRMPTVRYDLENMDGVLDVRYWSSLNSPVLDEGGEVIYIIHTTEDVTQQVKAEKDAQKMKSLKRSNDLLMQAPVAIGIAKGSNYVVELANDGLLEVWARKAEDVLGKPLFEGVPDLDGQGFKELLDQVVESGESFFGYEHPVRFIRYGKEEQLYFNFVYKPYYEEGQTKPAGVFTVGHDVTAQVVARREVEQAQAETERQKRLYETITSNTPDLIYVFDLNYRFTYANNALLTMWGKTWEQAVGKGLPENGYEPWHVEMHHREIDRVVATKQPIRGEVSFPHAVLGKRLYDYIFVPVINVQGEVEAVAGTTRDITEIRQAEKVLRRSQEKLEALVNERTGDLQRSNKSLEEFAYAASHDMKEPIRKIHFFADRLHERLKGRMEAEDERYFNRLEVAAKRMSTLIDDLLVYSHVSKEISSFEAVDLNDMLSFVLDDLELHIEQIGAVVEVEPMPVIMGRPRQLQQVFDNLINNALKYRKPDIPPAVKVSYQRVKGMEAPYPVADREKDYHLIQVQDNGIGFLQEDAERIFNTFTRLHGNQEYRGSGVGLSIVQKVVQNHGGYIWAESSSGNGAIFKILIPISESLHSVDGVVNTVTEEVQDSRVGERSSNTLQ